MVKKILNLTLQIKGSFLANWVEKKNLIQYNKLIFFKIIYINF